MQNIKGSALIPFVKTIRADKSGVYDKWLTDEDRTIAAGKVFPSSWYPFETYQRCLTAVERVVINGDDETQKERLYDWGYDAANSLLSGPYKNIIVQGSPQKSIENTQTWSVCL